MPITKLAGRQLKTDSVAADKIKDLTITAVDLAPGSITADKIDFSVAAGPGLELDPDTNTLQIRVGTGLQINSGDQSLEIDPDEVGGGTPGGSAGQLQFNDAGDFGGTSDLSWDSGTSRLSLGAGAPVAKLGITGSLVVNDTDSDQYAFWASNGPTLGGVRVWGLASGASANRVSIGQGSAGISVTPDANSTLTVFGSQAISSNLQGGAQNVLRVQNPNSSTPTNGAEARIRFQVGSTSLGNVGVASVGGLIEDVSVGSGALIFSTALSNVLAETMRLNSSGVLSVGRQATVANTRIEAQGFISSISEGSISAGLSPRMYGPVPGTSSAGVFFRTALGTEASPLAVTSGTGLGTINARGWEPVNGFSLTSRASINFNAIENFTDTAQGTSITFNVTNPTTLVGSQPLVIRSSSTGAARVGISQGNPQARLDIGSAGQGGANISGTDPAYTLGYTNVVFGKSDTPNVWSLGEPTGAAVVKCTTGPVYIGGNGGSVVNIDNGNVNASSLQLPGGWGIGSNGTDVTYNNSGNPSTLTISPTGTMTLQGSDNNLAFFGVQTSNNSNGFIPILRGARSRGTNAAPTAVQANDTLLFIGAAGHDGSVFTGSKAVITFAPTETWTPTAQGSRMFIGLTTPGTTTRRNAFRYEDGLVFQSSPATSNCFYSLDVTGVRQWIQYVDTAGAWGINDQTSGINVIKAEAGSPHASLWITAAGFTGMGTDTPSQRLHVSGSIRMVDGNEASGKVMTSSADGTGSWQTPSTSFPLHAPNGSILAPVYSFTDSNGSGLLYHNGVAIAFEGSKKFEVLSDRVEMFSPLLVSSDRVIVANAFTPASASATGTQGTISWDSDYIYVCVATDTWKRAALSTW